MSTELSRKERGLCQSCSNPSREGMVLCQECADKCRERYRKKAASGYCSRNGCWNVVASGASRCKECRVKRSVYVTQVYKDRKAGGLCPHCGKVPPEDGFESCSPCRASALERAHKGNFSGLRPAVIERDGGECQCCGENGALVHHINGNNRHNSMANLIHLCRKCHADIHKFGNRSSRAQSAALVVYAGQINNARKRPDRAGWNRIRQAVLGRDGRTCRLCGNEDRRMIVHHKNDRGLRDARPDNSKGNLMTLCRPCHASLTHLRNNTDRQLASKLIFALGPGTSGQPASQPAAQSGSQAV
jgi:5-methylcytosine-specific restriction endonuclease McrA